MLTSTIQLTLGHSPNLKEFFAYMLVGSIGQFTYSEYKVASPLWLIAHIGMTISEGAQLLSCAHLVGHTGIPLTFMVNLISERSFLGVRAWHFFLVYSLLQVL